jgi:hypothetical protein
VTPHFNVEISRSDRSVPRVTLVRKNNRDMNQPGGDDSKMGLEHKIITAMYFSHVYNIYSFYNPMQNCILHIWL